MGRSSEPRILREATVKASNHVRPAARDGRLVRKRRNRERERERERERQRQTEEKCTGSFRKLAAEFKNTKEKRKGKLRKDNLERRFVDENCPKIVNDQLDR